MESETRIVIVDDHPALLAGLRRIVESEARFKVVAELTDGNAALEQIPALQPDIAILDIELPGADGFAITAALAKQNCPTAIVFFTSHRKEVFFEDALALGVKGYVLKDSGPTEILSCLRAVAAGEHYAGPALTSYLMHRAQRTAHPRSQTPGTEVLTPTEKEILRLLADFKTNKEIALELGISYRTVETHRHNMIEKLELKEAHALMKFALAHYSTHP